MRYRLVAPDNGMPQPCTTFNGNVVLVPKSVYRRVGGIERRFSHAYADFDYGLRARALGFQVVVSGNAVGTCAPAPGTVGRAVSLSHLPIPAHARTKRDTHWLIRSLPPAARGASMASLPRGHLRQGYRHTCTFPDASGAGPRRVIDVSAHACRSPLATAAGAPMSARQRGNAVCVGVAPH